MVIANISWLCHLFWSVRGMKSSYVRKCNGTFSLSWSKTQTKGTRRPSGEVQHFRCKQLQKFPAVTVNLVVEDPKKSPWQFPLKIHCVVKKKKKRSLQTASVHNPVHYQTYKLHQPLFPYRLTYSIMGHFFQNTLKKISSYWD